MATPLLAQRAAVLNPDSPAELKAAGVRVQCQKLQTPSGFDYLFRVSFRHPGPEKKVQAMLTTRDGREDLTHVSWHGDNGSCTASFTVTEQGLSHARLGLTTFSEMAKMGASYPVNVKAFAEAAEPRRLNMWP